MIAGGGRGARSSTVLRSWQQPGNLDAVFQGDLLGLWGAATVFLCQAQLMENIKEHCLATLQTTLAVDHPEIEFDDLAMSDFQCRVRHQDQINHRAPRAIVRLPVAIRFRSFDVQDTRKKEVPEVMVLMAERAHMPTIAIVCERVWRHAPCRRLGARKRLIGDIQRASTANCRYHSNDYLEIKVSPRARNACDGWICAKKTAVRDFVLDRHLQQVVKVTLNPAGLEYRIKGGRTTVRSCTSVVVKVTRRQPVVFRQIERGLRHRDAKEVSQVAAINVAVPPQPVLNEFETTLLSPFCLGSGGAI